MQALDTMSLATVAGAPLQKVDNDSVRILFESRESIGVLIPDDIAPDVLWKNLGACCRVMGVGKDVIAKAKPLIGRMLVVIQRYPDLFTTQGYRTFDDFMGRGMGELFGIPRSEAFQLKQIATVLPNLDPERCVQLGTTKVSMIAAVVAENNFGPEMQEKLLQMAGNGKTIVTLRQELEDKNFTGVGSLDYQSLNIVVNRAAKERLEEFLDMEEVAAYCGTSNKGTILTKMIEECSGEWLTRGRSIINSGRSEIDG